MARYKEFEPQKALDQAMHLFWWKGYEATTMDELCAVMGIKRGSLYATFGDKRALFFKALARYVELDKPVIPIDEKGGSAMEAIAAIFQRAVEQAINDPQCRGCFMVNTITELAAVDADVARFGESQRQAFEKIFFTLLTHAEREQEIPANQDLRATAQFLANAFFGLRVTAKLNPSRSILDNIVKTTLSVVG